MKVPVIIVRILRREREVIIGEVKDREPKKVPATAKKAAKKRRWWIFNPEPNWSIRRKKATNVVILVLSFLFVVAVVLAIYFYAATPERTVTKIVTVPGAAPAPVTTTIAVSLPEDRAKIVTLEAELQKTKSALSDALAKNSIINPESIEFIPKTWSSFTGEGAMSLALETFGNIRIKVLFSEGSIPLLSEAVTLIAQKPKDLSLLAWIGNTKEAKYWPIGQASPNTGGGGPTDVFIAKDSAGVARYYYIAHTTGDVILVDRNWVTQNSIYWLFIPTPAYPR